MCEIVAISSGDKEFLERAREVLGGALRAIGEAERRAGEMSAAAAECVCGCEDGADSHGVTIVITASRLLELMTGARLRIRTGHGDIALVMGVGAIAAARQWSNEERAESAAGAAGGAGDTDPDGCVF